MMKRELLDNGNIWQKSDGRWIGMVRYKDEFGVAQRKSFSSKKKKTLQAKMTEYVKNFNEQVTNSDEARKPLKESMKNWLRVYKFPEVERTTYDRYECTAEHQIYPYIGNKPVGDVTSADIKKLLTKHMNKGYAFTTSKKAYSLLKMFFKQLYQEGAMLSVGNRYTYRYGDHFRNQRFHKISVRRKLCRLSRSCSGRTLQF